MKTTEERCKQIIYVDTWDGSRYCSRNATKDGYCTQHHPDIVEARRAATAAAWEAKQAKRRAPFEQISALRAELDVLRGFYISHRNAASPADRAQREAAEKAVLAYYAAQEVDS